MLVTPRYGDEPVLRLDADLGDAAVPLVRQRARLADAVAGLSDEQWAAPSRCAGWSVQDVVTHLVIVNMFWTTSIQAGLAGEPSRMLAGFDPVTVPARMVSGAPALSPAEALDRLRVSNDALAAALTGLDAASWELLAEAPIGHVSLRLVVLHALWDAWVHERDILLPLGLAPVEEPDEIAASLAYAAALGPAFASTGGATRTGSFAVHATDPDVRLAVDVGPVVVLREGMVDATTDVTLTGRAVDLLEALSLRADMQQPPAADDRWLLGTLDVVFEQERS